MADYFLRITQCIQYVQAKVEDGDGAPQIRLNRRQCVYLAHELSKLSQFLQDREVHHFGLEKGIRRTALLHLHGTVKRAQMLVEGCCCENTSWLATGITMGDTKEEFIAILLDLHQWKFVLGIAICASAGLSEKAELQQLWETGEEGYQSLSKRSSKMQNEIRDGGRQDQEELLEKIANLTIEDQRGDDYVRGVYLKAWLDPAEGNLQNVEELKTHNISGDMETVLGTGGSGSVLKGKWLGQEVALKIQDYVDPTEATILGKLQHPNIVRFFHYWEHTPAIVNMLSRSCIVMELMPTDLRKHIARMMGQRSKLPSTTREGQAGSMPFLLPVAIDTMLQVAQAMRALHEKGLMHRDLKTSNILVKLVHEGYLELHSERYLEVKLADFGSAKTYANTSQTTDLTRNQGTSPYGAPEIFEKEKIIRERNFPPKADVWSFGMTCSEILTGAAPFAGDEHPTTLHARIKKDGLRPNLPEDCPWYLQFCIRSCWEVDPQKRPSFSDLCKMLRHAKLMSLGLIDVVDVKCLFWYQSGVHIRQAQDEGKKSRSILGAIRYTLRRAGGSWKSQSQKPPASGAEGSWKSQSQKPSASGAEGISNPQSQKPPASGAEGISNSQSPEPPASGAEGCSKSQSPEVPASGMEGSAKSQNSSGIERDADPLPSFNLEAFLTFELARRTRRDQQKLQRLFDRREMKTTIFSKSELLLATQYFGTRMKLGGGEVYKGILPGGSAVAVKRLWNGENPCVARDPDGGLSYDFLHEVTALASLKHKNLVTLQGACIHGDEMFLVYEFVGSSILADILFDHKSYQPMTWPMRFNICLGVARGLHYLHAEVNPRISHREIKSSNVLLDLNLDPRIADLGLAYYFQGEGDSRVGTFGYAALEWVVPATRVWQLLRKAPEFAIPMYARVSDEKDVYSFGVLVLEIVRGMQNDSSGSLAKRALELDNRGRLMELIDPDLLTPDVDEGEVQIVLSTALACIHSDEKKRPTMAHVLEMLEPKTDPKS